MTARRKVPYRTESERFVDTAPVRFSVSRPLRCSALRLFEVFEDADAWTQWAGLSSVRWTTPGPVRAGSTRTVELGPMEIDEVFLIWRPGERMTFCFTAATSGFFRAFVEDYRVTPIDDGHCEVEWHMGIELAGLARVLNPIFPSLMRVSCRRALERLATLIDESERAPVGARARKGPVA